MFTSTCDVSFSWRRKYFGSRYKMFRFIHVTKYHRKKMNTNLKHGINFILALDIYLFIFFSSHFLFAIFSRCWDHKLWIYRWYWHIREIGTASVILCDSFYLNWMTHTHTHKKRTQSVLTILMAHIFMRWFSSQICNQLRRKIPPNLRFSRLVFTFDFHPLKKKIVFNFIWNFP